MLILQMMTVHKMFLQVIFTKDMESDESDYLDFITLSYKNLVICFKFTNF